MTELPLDVDSRVEDFQHCLIHRAHLSRGEQEQLLREVQQVIEQAPLVHQMTPWGKPMSVAMTNAGRYGWVSDRGGYRYEPTMPGTNDPWPSIPSRALAVWRAVADWPREPHCCLINFYGDNAKMGLHQDADEQDMIAPVVSISLGDPGRFRVGGCRRKDPTRSTLLHSGDVAVLTGPSRQAFHGVDGVKLGESDLVPGGGRFNLTLRVVDRES